MKFVIEYWILTAQNKENTRKYNRLLCGKSKQGTARTFLKKGLWVEIGRVNVEYIIYFPERIGIGLLFPINREEILFHPVAVKVNSYKVKQLTSFFCCATSSNILYQ
jgi:hypothetical protein